MQKRGRRGHWAASECECKSVSEGSLLIQYSWSKNLKSIKICTKLKRKNSRTGKEFGLFSLCELNHDHGMKFILLKIMMKTMNDDDR